MTIFSPDTCIFINSFLGKEVRERNYYIQLIWQYLKQNPSILVESVKKEFDSKIDEFHTTIESMVFHLDNGKTLDDAIELLPEISLMNSKDKIQLKTGLKILGVDMKDIDKNINARMEFRTEITSKFSDIHREFEYYRAQYCMKDKLGYTEVKCGLEQLEADFVKINDKHGRLIHGIDKEHWVRTALVDRNKDTKFLTSDYFGLKQNPKKLTEVASKIESVVNNQLRSQFSFLFKSAK